jgi:DNA topoisomerase-1
LDKNLKKLKKGQPGEKGLPSNEASTKAALQKISESIATAEYNLKNKDENKQVSLGTSKINYMDPRITISWCKNKEVPIEKVFPTTLRKKFAWAMDSDPNYQF